MAWHFTFACFNVRLAEEMLIINIYPDICIYLRHFQSHELKFQTGFIKTLHYYYSTNNHLKLINLFNICIQVSWWLVLVDWLLVPKTFLFHFIHFHANILSPFNNRSTRSVFQSEKLSNTQLGLTQLNISNAMHYYRNWQYNVRSTIWCVCVCVEIIQSIGCCSVVARARGQDHYLTFFLWTYRVM